MPEDIQERMCALIAQHGSAFVALVALRQQPEAQPNDKQIDSLENPIPHINVPAKFNQDTFENQQESRSNTKQR